MSPDNQILHTLVRFPSRTYPFAGVTKPLNVNILKFLIICCKGKILSSMKVKVHHLIHFLSIFTYPTRFNCIMFQRDRVLVSDRPATSNVGNPATRWIFEQCWMLESLEYISELCVHSRPSIQTTGRTCVRCPRRRPLILCTFMG